MSRRKQRSKAGPSHRKCARCGRSVLWIFLYGGLCRACARRATWEAVRRP